MNPGFTARMIIFNTILISSYCKRINAGGFRSMCSLMLKIMLLSRQYDIDNYLKNKLKFKQILLVLILQYGYLLKIYFCWGHYEL